MSNNERTYIEVDKTFNTLSTIQKAEAPPFFTENVMTRISELNQQQSVPVTLQLKWTFAVLILLIGMNGMVFFNSIPNNDSSQISRQDQLEAFGKEYLSIDNEIY